MIIYFNLHCTKSKKFISIKILYLYGIPKYSRGYYGLAIQTKKI